MVVTHVTQWSAVDATPLRYVAYYKPTCYELICKTKTICSGDILGTWLLSGLCCGRLRLTFTLTCHLPGLCSTWAVAMVILRRSFLTGRWR